MAERAAVIQHGDWWVELDGANGGQIVRADWRGHHVLAPGIAGRSAATQHAGCYPLVPFSNRIRDAQFRFEERRVFLPPPDYAAPHALHGLGWRSAWQVTQAAAGVARLSFEHPPGAWPWRYAAEQHISVDADGLQVTLALTNLDRSPMPAGIGLHPYFARPEHLRLDAGVAGRWATAPGSPGLPVDRIAAPGDLASPGLDHCFYGWDGRAVIGGRRGLIITVEACQTFRNLVIYTPEHKPYFCAEPVSHVNDALNADDLSEGERMHVLQPGETLSGAITLTASLA